MGREGAMRKETLARVRKGVVIFFCLVAASLMWPIYPLFSTIEPRLLGIPFSLAYLIIWLLLSFLVLLGLFLLEDRSEGVD